MIPDSKKRHVISLEKLPAEVMEIFNDKYPKGFNDYLQDLVKYAPDGREPFYAVTIETETDVWLVKIKVKTDDAEDIERWLEVEEEAENEQVAGASADADVDGGTLPDDNISQYGGDDDSAES